MSAMEEDTEFRDLIIKRLENNGVLFKMKAALRAQIHKLVDKENRDDNSQTDSITNSDSVVEYHDDATSVALSLVHDLLECLSLDVTKNVLTAESGEKVKYSCDSRSKLMEKLQIADGSDEDSQSASINNFKVPVLVKYLKKSGALSNVNETFAVSPSTSSSTE
ncbi:Centrosomal protein 43 [Pseudolycoriella hygida]|uniref:Centrosomal protein 43 n=1 Tax=Pseudolycoriella hygida TaxID=35572 RepID=A0A9Q0N0W3_9DIPT|nr:Centrosomal protein 43 [Pseudolycoriella hygida]